MLDFYRFREEIIEFMCKETLQAIDFGVLDLGHVRDYELKEIFIHLENELTVELKKNYRQNRTGIFRVSYRDDFWCYEESGYLIKAKCIEELRNIVESQNRIWYVFDETLGGKCVRCKRIG